MDFISIGPLEILLILLLAFLLFGPEKLPDLAARAGKIYHNLTRSVDDLTKTIKEDIRVESQALEEDLNQSAPSSDKKAQTDKNPEIPSLK